MTDTPNLKMPYIASSQAQKHVTHNEALRVLDAIVQLSVIDRNLTAPPGSLADGVRYIVGASATGAWATHDGEIAAWQDNAWSFHAPEEGWLCWVADEAEAFAYDGALWQPISAGGGASTNPTPLVGVNATADTTNRLSVTSPASLFNHSGNGHQLKLNKNAAADAASLLYQTGFSGRAEIGLAGDDDFHFKVSPDGSSWYEGITIDKDTGEVSFPVQPWLQSRAPDIILQEEQPAGTNGGTFTAGARSTRVLNTEVRDVHNRVILAGNQFTLLAGEYYIEADAPSLGVGKNKITLRNTTDSVDEIFGTAEYSAELFSTSRALLAGVVATAASKAFSIEHQCSITEINNGLGIASNFGSDTEVFSRVRIWTLA